MLVIQKIKTNGFFFLILENSKKTPVALIGFYANDDVTKVAYLSCISVLASFQKIGLGQFLFDEMCKIAKCRGMELLRFNVVKNNQKAIRFYQKNGAVAVGVGRDEKRWLMEKILA